MVTDNKSGTASMVTDNKSITVNWWFETKGTYLVHPKNHSNMWDVKQNPSEENHPIKDVKQNLVVWMVIIITTYQCWTNQI